VDNRLGPAQLIRENLLDGLHHAVAPEFGKTNLGRRRVKDPGKERFL
jgi:hypothetical protein